MTSHILIPTLASKYPGSVYQSSNGTYRLEFTFPDSGVRYTMRFSIYTDALEHLRWLSEQEDNVRVKNIIHHEPGTEAPYRVMLTGDHYMLFDEVDLPLVHDNIWFYDNQRGYAKCSAKPSLPSTLFHMCMMPPIDEDHEYIHLNGLAHDNRRCNVVPRRRTRTKRKHSEEI